MESNHWADISRRAVLAFESRYTLNLYSYLALRKNRRNTSEDPITIEELRDLLNVPAGKLTSWSDLRRFALDRAQAEINQLADFSFGYEAIKVGRRVGKVRLFWGRKDIDGLRAAEQAFQMTRLERAAQRKGVETVVDDRIEIAEGLAAINQSKEALE
jgi:plasmid replication initiation protein